MAEAGVVDPSGVAGDSEELPEQITALLRRVARPAQERQDLLAVDAARCLVQMGATCEPVHIGPYYRVPGSDQAERCATCGEVSGK